MLFPFFIAAEFMIAVGIIAGTIGYSPFNKEWVWPSITYYLANLFQCAVMVAAGCAFIAVYTRVFGWPSPE